MPGRSGRGRSSARAADGFDRVGVGIEIALGIVGGARAFAEHVEGIARRLAECGRARSSAASMVSPSTKWLPISRIACRVAARTAGTPSRFASRPIVPSGVSPGWITRADMPSAQADALTRKALDFVS